MGKDEEKNSSSPDEIWQKICNMNVGSTSVGDRSNKWTRESLQDLAKVFFLSSQLIVNEIRLLREDLKKSQK